MRTWFLLIFLGISLHAATNMWVTTGKAYGIEPRLLYAISKVESNLHPYNVSVNYKKITAAQKQKLYKYLKMRRIPYYTYTQVIEIHNKNMPQAKAVVRFLDKNHYSSFDIGLMNINNIHKRSLAKRGISLEDLLDEKTNLKVAAGILLYCYKRHGTNYKAINAYNGKIKGNPYYSKVFSVFKRLLLPNEDTSKQLFYCAL